MIALLAAVFVLAAVMLVTGALHRDDLRGRWAMEDGTVFRLEKLREAGEKKLSRSFERMTFFFQTALTKRWQDGKIATSSVLN